MANVLDSNIFEVNKQQYKMIATVYDDAAYVLGLEQQDKSNEMILATENIIEFQYVNQLGKLCLDGSLTYKDTEGFVSNFLNVEYVGLDIFIAKQLQESDGQFTRQKNDENNQMTHSFMVSNIEILERHATDIIYKFHLISRQWYNFSANIDINTYGQENNNTEKEDDKPSNETSNHSTPSGGTTGENNNQGTTGNTQTPPPAQEENTQTGNTQAPAAPSISN